MTPEDISQVTVAQVGSPVNETTSCCLVAINEARDQAANYKDSSGLLMPNNSGLAGGRNPPPHPSLRSFGKHGNVPHHVSSDTPTGPHQKYVHTLRDSDSASVGTGLFLEPGSSGHSFCWASAQLHCSAPEAHVWF